MMRSFTKLLWLLARSRKSNVYRAKYLSADFMQGFSRPRGAGPSSEAALVSARRDREKAPAAARSHARRVVEEQLAREVGTFRHVCYEIAEQHGERQRCGNQTNVGDESVDSMFIVNARLPQQIALLPVSVFWLNGRAR